MSGRALPEMMHELVNYDTAVSCKGLRGRRPEGPQLQGFLERRGVAGTEVQGQVKLKGQGFWKHPLTHLAKSHTASVMLLSHRQGCHSS